jgi:hypothetical protein
MMHCFDTLKSISIYFCTYLIAKAMCFTGNCFNNKHFFDKITQLAPLNELRNIFGLGKREAEGILSDVKALIYRRTLAKVFNTELASVPSKAAYLQILCEKLQFDPELASKLHEGTISTLSLCNISFTAWQ